MSRLEFPELIVILIIVIILAVALLPWFMIYKKAGYSPAMGCLMYIPLVNVIMLFILAFTQWPIERELENARNASFGPKAG
jgi:hypothetical protein